MELPAQLEFSPAWRQVRAELVRALGEATFEIWFSEVRPQAWDGSVLILHGPVTKRRWISGRYRPVLERSVQAGFGPAARVEFATERGRARSVADDHQPDLAPSAFDFNPRYTFEQFIIGDDNRLAHAAALAVAEMPGGAYNPLFLYSPPGLGKTHLLHAVGNYLLMYGAGATVRYTTVETFTNQFVSALESKKAIERFKHAYRDADVLLIDDVQFLASKARTEEEFFHTFNALYESGRQLVITCDRLPLQLTSVAERLRERFNSGLVAELRPPDLATRVAILRKRAQLDRITPLDPGVLELIAARVTSNIRSLEGALIQVVAYASLADRPIDIPLATEMLDRIHPRVGSDPITIDRIQQAVGAHYEVSVDELRSSGRTARIAWPRQVAIHFARNLTRSSLEDIGAAFGGRNHATVIHACKRVSDRLLDDADAAADVHKLEGVLRAGQGDRDS
ncbi:MAG TPA: chromosomal replication initiator protein DnaA [Solirubrobacteraceae bacterium]|nr:chromosomal replication initiator protein DnaA [Solirubrobacteraceae bacterium]